MQNASDDKNTLYLWDLTSIGNIKLEVTTSFKSPVKSVYLIVIVAGITQVCSLKLHCTLSLAHPCLFSILCSYLVKASELLHCRYISGWTLARSRPTIFYVAANLHIPYPTLGSCMKRRCLLLE